MLTKVTFSDREVQPRQPPALELPAPPPPISLRESLDLARPVGSTTALLSAALTASMPAFTVTLSRYLQAEVRAYT